MDASRKIILGLVAALVVVAVGMYFWKTSAVSAIEAKMSELQAQQAQVRTDLIEQARRLDAQHAEEALRRFSTAFAWAIRRELMASNLDQVDQYFTELVQMNGFQSAVLASPDGKIVVASDRKKLAQSFSSLYPGKAQQAKDVQVERTADGVLRAVIPILGLNQQLGTVVLEFAPPGFDLQS
jgi:nitrogen fixation/metabolism regulation signal transduction histidine kinase